MLTSFDKALVPVVVAVVLAALAHFGVSGQMSVESAVMTLVTAGLVYLVPNKK